MLKIVCIHYDENEHSYGATMLKSQDDQPFPLKWGLVKLPSSRYKIFEAPELAEDSVSFFRKINHF